MNGRDKRRSKIRKTIRGTKNRPRLVVFRSNRFLYAQIIDDTEGKTLVSVNKMTDGEKAGEEMAQKAVKAGIKTVIFDRAGYKYHGHIKKLAEAARKTGLIF